MISPLPTHTGADGTCLLVFYSPTSVICIIVPPIFGYLVIHGSQSRTPLGAGCHNKYNLKHEKEDELRIMPRVLVKLLPSQIVMQNSAVSREDTAQGTQGDKNAQNSTTSHDTSFLCFSGG